MTDFITTAFVQDYKTTVMFLAQQMGSRSRDLVSTDTYKGMAGKAVEQFGQTMAQKRTQRHADTPLMDVNQDARWVYPTDYEWAELIDDQDKLRMAIDPTSPIAQAGAFAMGRSIDDEILGAFYSAAHNGQTGSTTVAFDGSNQYVGPNIGGTSTNLNIEKLREGRRIFEANNIDLDQEQLWMLVTSKEADALLGLTQVVSTDFNDRPVLVDGKVTRFLGINFRHIEFTSSVFANASQMLNGSNRLCPLFVQRGMHLGVWEDTTARMSQRADKGYATQVYLRHTIGATRIDEKRVVQIECAG